MRKLYTLFLLVAGFCVNAQTTVTIGTGTSSAATGAFISTSTTTNRYSLNYTIYTAAEIVANGGFAGTITKLAWQKAGTGEYTNGDAHLKVYLKTVSISQHASAAAEDWANIIGGATLVYSSTTFSWPTGTGFKEITLQNPFSWDGSSNLAILVDWYRPSTPTAAINWLYTTAASTNKQKLGSSPLTVVDGLNGNRPNVQFTITPAGVCSDPANPGQAVSNITPAGICQGGSVVLNLSGNSTGSNQTYKWQSSSSETGPYTDISAEASTSGFVINPVSTTAWYRAVVKCGPSGTPQTSLPVQVVVNPSLAGGTYSINNTLPTTGSNFNSFSDALNRMSCGISGNVIFEVAAGQTFFETLDIGIQGTALSSVTFRKAGTGANPKISRIGTSASAEYIVKLTGADFITFDGIDFEQTGTSSSDWVEYGIFIANASATNGAQNNTLKNGVISLSNGNTSARGVFMDQVTTPTNTSGANSGNKFLNMTVRNSFTGYYLTGSTTNYPDDGTEIGTEGGGASIIENLGNGTAAASMYGLYCTYQANFKLRNTQIRNLANGGTSLIYATYFLTSATNTVEISGNTYSNISGGGTVTGIYMTSGTSLNIFNNKFFDFRTSGSASSLRVIDLSATGLSANIHSNQIYNISSAGITTTTVGAIEVSTGLAYNIYNNMISDLRASTSTSTSGSVRGISIVGGSTGGVVRLYYNTILLTDVGTTANYTSAGIYNSSVTPTLDIQNNLVINRTDVGAGTRAVALWKTSATVNLDIASDNNLYYAGVPSSKNLIYYDGTNSVQTLADYKTLAGVSPREANSRTENVAFLPISAGVIRIDPNIQSVAESGGKEIAGYTADFEGTQRGPYPIAGQTNGAGTKPDIGADEYDGRTGDIVGPQIVVTSLLNTSSTANRTVTVTITDPSGVARGNIGPRLYYRKSGSTTYAFDDNPTVTGDDYTFTFNYALIGGVIGGDVVEYYFAAQDQNGYVSTFPFGGSGINPPGTTAPGTPLTYRILYSLNGTYTVGPSGNYQNLTAIAGLLNNLSEVTGPTTFELQADYDGTSGETFPIQFNQLLTSNPNWTVTVRPAAGVTGRVTSGDPGSGSPLINLNGTDRIIFDGRPGGVGTAREWTFRNTRTAATIGSAFRLINDATNDTLRYLNMESRATSTSQGLVFFSTSASGVSGNSFNMVANNLLSGRTDDPSVMSNGVYSSGTTATPNSENTIQGNHIANFVNYGIYLAGDGNGSNWKINGNHIYSDSITTSSKYGIYITSDNAINTLISNNFIGGSTQGAAGTMTVNGNVAVMGIYTTAGSAIIQGNTIANMSNINAGASARVRGIYLATEANGSAITGNTIFNLTSSGAGTGVSLATETVVGILIVPNSVFVSFPIRDNVIYNLSAESATALSSTNMVIGISAQNLQNTGIERNRIYDLKNKTTGSTINQPPTVAGIRAAFFSNSLIANNMISLGGTENTNTQFIGILQLAPGTSSGNSHHYYYNTVSITGTAGGSFNSYAFSRGIDTTTVQQQFANLRNNIFYVTRTGGGAVNYPIASRGAFSGSGWTSDYNNLYNSDASAIGYWNSTGLNLSGWQTSTSNDGNSKTISVEFVNPLVADFHLTGGSVGNIALGGIPITAVINDFDLQVRNEIRPYMGADEGAIGLPVRLDYFKGARQGNVHMLNWQGYCTGDNNLFVVERSADGRAFKAIGEVSASRAECGVTLGLVDRNPLPGINYYRLKIKDENGQISYSFVLAILNKETGFEIVSAFPTLTQNNLFVNVSSTHKVNLDMTVVDIQGRNIKRISKMVEPGTALIPVDVNSLAAGSYILNCHTTEGYTKAIRFVKN